MVPKAKNRKPYRSLNHDLSLEHFHYSRRASSRSKSGAFAVVTKLDIEHQLRFALTAFMGTNQPQHAPASIGIVMGGALS